MQARCWNHAAIIGALLCASSAFAANWDTFKADHCTSLGRRQYSSVLRNISGSWEKACAATGATIKGQWFPRPARCRNNGQMWGEFDVLDSTCDAKWGSFQRDACVREGVRQYSSVIQVPGGFSWETACASTPATVAGVYFARPTQCVNTGLNMWGRFHVADTSCSPYWGALQNSGCVGMRLRKYSAVLENVLPGNSWETACAAKSNTVVGRYFSTPTRCVNTTDRMWGEWEIQDDSCVPRWGAFTKAECSDSGKRVHTAPLLDVPPNTLWESACMDTPATVEGKWSRRPLRCDKATAAGVGLGISGRFEREDVTCSPVNECTDPAIPAGAFAKSGNNGTASCEAFCANRDGTNGPKGSCVKGIVQSGPNAGQCIRCSDVPEETGDTNVTCYCKAPLSGFADLHSHPFSYEGFGGLAFHGKAFGPLDTAMPWCDSVHGPGGSTDFISKFLGHGILGHLVGGNPQFDGWPRWNSASHQQMHEDSLRRAWEGGLRLLVAHAVNSEDIYHFPVFALRKAGRTGKDMEAVDLQIAEAFAMQAWIDSKAQGPGTGFFRIVRSSAEARSVIAQGKLAVVLGIEVDRLFDCDNEAQCSEAYVVEQLDKYQALGVRHLFPIHFKANAFGGAALSNPLTDGPSRFCFADGYEYQRDFTKLPICSSVGLTSRGKFLIREMMKRRMLIDIDHMSAYAFNDALDLVEPSGYPVISGHTGFFDIASGEKRHEGNLKAEQVERIRKVGGLLAVITHQGNSVNIHEGAGPAQPRIPHDCGETSSSTAQAYLYATRLMQGGAVALGTDFNGLAGSAGPRFGGEACPGGDAAARVAAVARQQHRVRYPLAIPVQGPVNSLVRSSSAQRTFDFNVDGLAHVGLLPDLIEDWRVQGMRPQDLDPLYRSAEAYVNLWERAEQAQLQP